MEVIVNEKPDMPKYYPKLMKDKEGTIALVFYFEMKYWINIIQYKGTGDFYLPCYEEDKISLWTELPKGTTVQLTNT